MATETIRRSTAPVVVELVGAPGAGKTTLLPAVLRACRAAGLHPYTVVEAARPFAARTPVGRTIGGLLPTTLRRKALWAVFLGARALGAVRLAAGRPRLVRYVLASQRGRPPGADRRERRVLHWYARSAGAYRFLTARARAGEAIVMDEGFVHRAVQLHASSVEAPEPARIEKYADLIPRPDLLVHVRAPVEVCERRVRSRGPWERFRGRDPRELSRFVAHAHRATELVVEAVRARGWPVIAIDNDGEDPAEAGAALAPRVVAALPVVRRR